MKPTSVNYDARETEGIPHVAQVLVEVLLGDVCVGIVFIVGESRRGLAYSSSLKGTTRVRESGSSSR